MAEKKSNRISIDVEETIYALLVLVSQEGHVSISSIIRIAILKDLEDRGLLTTDVLKRLAI